MKPPCEEHEKDWRTAMVISAIKWGLCGSDLADLGWNYAVWFRCPCGHQNRLKAHTPKEEKVLTLQCRDCGLASDVTPPQSAPLGESGSAIKQDGN